MTRRLPWLLLLGVVIAGGCRRDAPEPGDGDRAAPQAESRAEGASVPAEVPRPELDDLEKATRRQLEEGRETFEGVLANPEATPEIRGQAYGELGMLYHAYRLGPEAEVAYRNAAALLPDDHRWPYLLGRLLESRGDREEAVEDLRRAVELAPGNSPALLELAELELDLGRSEEAAARFRRAMETDPAAVAAAAFGLGRIAAAEGRPEEAAKLFERALAEAPDADRIHYPLALAYRDLGQIERTERQLALAGEKRPGVPDPLMEEVRSMSSGLRLHQVRAGLAFRQGRVAEARRELEKAMELAPEDPEVRLNLGTALLESGSTEEAEKQYREALRLASGEPIEARIRFSLGTALGALGRQEEARQHLRAALELDPGFQEARQNLASSLLRGAEVEEALELYRELEAAEPELVAAYLGQANALARLGDYAGARAALERGTERLPGHVGLHHVLARLLATAPDPAARDGERALDLARRVFASHRSIDFAETVAMALAELGRFEEAAEWQGSLVKEARREGQDELVPRLQARLESYESERPIRESVTE